MTHCKVETEEGAKESKNLNIITEFSPGSLRIFGVSPEDYLGKLAEHGFELCQIDDEQRAINHTVLPL